MARAIRVTHTTTRQIPIVGTGVFGERVCRFLAAGSGKCLEYGVTDDIQAAFADEASAVVLALWRPDPGLCEIADDLSFRYRVPWLPVIAEHPVIRVGPPVHPPAGPCFRCYVRRRAQHDRQRWATTALREAYDRDASCGPGGYLPHQARMAAAIAEGTVRNLITLDPAETSDRAPGLVRTIALNTTLRVNQVIACDGCDRCGPLAPLSRPDWLAQLVNSLQAGPAGAHEGSPRAARRDEDRRLATR
jgi:bacteriocin biosynthesis cyclodehydratase domain-containing protein